MILTGPIATLITGSLLASAASACMCFPTPLCHEIATLSPANNAILVATVIDVWPTREIFAFDHSSQRTLVQTKQRILRRWRTTLSPEEKHQIRVATSESSIIQTFQSLQRVRVVVTESLVGPKIKEFYTEATGCGYRFQPGVTYFIDANREGSSRFSVHACSHTRKVDSTQALEDIEMLRALRDGHPPAPRIYGRVLPSHIQLDTKVRLIDEQNTGQDRTAALDADGRFSFDNLRSPKYRLHVQDSRGSSESSVAIASLGCFEADLSFSNGWHIYGSPVIVPPHSRETPMILEPPPILEPH